MEPSTQPPVVVVVDVVPVVVPVVVVVDVLLDDELLDCEPLTTDWAIYNSNSLISMYACVSLSICRFK